MPNKIDRRTVIAGLAAVTTVMSTQGAQAALTNAQARDLIGRVVADINRVINSGQSESRMLAEFERIFGRYADVPVIARSTLGPVARQASAAQLSAYSEAFSRYLSRKYGRRFREFIGGKIEVTEARQVRQYFEVDTVARLQGQAPFGVVFRVSDRSGQNRFFDIVIEGISLGKTERTEIQAMLDARRGDLDRLISDLAKIG